MSNRQTGRMLYMLPIFLMLWLANANQMTEGERKCL